MERRTLADRLGYPSWTRIYILFMVGTVFLLSVKYFPTNLVYPFTLRLTCIINQLQATYFTDRTIVYTFI